MQETAMNSSGVTVSDSPTPANLFDEFEETFQNLLAPLTKEDPLNGINLEELRVNAETNSQRFLELAHRMKASFLQKRFLLSVQKPESLLLEENHEMRVEIQRKDELIKKQTEKLTEWQNTLMNLITRVGSVPSYGNRSLITASSGSGVSPTNQSPVMTSGGGQPISNQNTSPQMNSLGMSGVMNHGPSNVSHGINISSGTAMSHQPVMGQMAPGGATISGMSQGNYQQMNAMNNSNNPMQQHSTSISSMTQGTMSMGGSCTMSSSMGPVMTPGGVGSQVSTASGMFHGSGVTSSMGSMPPQGGLQGPLAYLEKTTTNIGMPDSRR